MVVFYGKVVIVYYENTEVVNRNRKRPNFPDAALAQNQKKTNEKTLYVIQ